MARTPEEVLLTVYKDGCKLALERGFTQAVELPDKMKVLSSIDPKDISTWLIQINRGSIFTDGRDIVGLVLGKEIWKSLREPTPCFIYAAVPSIPSTERALILFEQLSTLVVKQHFSNEYGRWFSIAVHPGKNDLYFNGSSAADMMLRGENKDWLLEDSGREALKAIIGDSFDLLRRYHNLMALIPQTSSV